MRSLLAFGLLVVLVVLVACGGEPPAPARPGEVLATAPGPAGERRVGARGFRRVGQPLRIPEAVDRPNVLLISFDTVRADRMSSYGNRRPTTPNLDALAARGTRFADCTAQAPFTPHSYSSLFSSLYVADLPVRERARDAERQVVRAGLEDHHVTLAEMMRDAGYHTAAFVQLWFTPAFGLTQGYERVVYEEQPLTGVVEDAVRWLRSWKREASDRPFFLFAYAFDVHYRFMDGRPRDAHVFGGDPDGFNIDRTVLQPFRKGELRPSAADLDNALTLYDEGLYWADREVQALLDELAALGVEDSTIVVFVSDHGEEFTEHGYISHGQSNFRTTVHVPLIVYDPRAPRPRVVDEPVMNLDVMPTLLDLCDVPVPETVKGASLANLVRGKSQPALGQRYLFSEGAWNGFVGLVRAGRWAYLMDERGGAHLFDHRQDPREERNLASRLPALARHLEQVLFAHKRAGLATQVLDRHGLFLELDRMGLPVLDPAALAASRPAAEPRLDDESIERLRALGYLE